MWKYFVEKYSWGRCIESASGKPGTHQSSIRTVCKLFKLASENCRSKTIDDTILKEVERSAKEILKSSRKKSLKSRLIDSGAVCSNCTGLRVGNCIGGNGDIIRKSAAEHPSPGIGLNHIVHTPKQLSPVAVNENAGENVIPSRYVCACARALQESGRDGDVAAIFEFYDAIDVVRAR